MLASRMKVSSALAVTLETGPESPDLEVELRQ